MVSRRIKALLGLYGLIFLSAIVQSCCEEDLLITSEGYMSAWLWIETENGSSRETIDTITGDFYLDASFHQKVVAANNYSLMGSAYATTCQENMLNTIDKSSLSLVIDQSFVLNEDTVPPNSNLFVLQESGIDWNVNEFGAVMVHFTEDFFNRASLQNGDYTFLFEGRTSDNTNLSAETELVVAL